MTREELLAQVKRKRMIAEVQAKRAAAQPVSDSMFEENNVVQEQHPEIGTIDRLLVKNLAISPEVGAKYLREKHPGLDVRVHNGEIIAKTPGEKSFKVLDPDTGFFSKDFVADAGDVAFDVGKGVAQSAATSLGAAGGLPGAMAAGGASGAGLEVLKQKLGYALGLPQPDLDKTQVAVEGGLGALVAPAEKALKAGYGAFSKKFLPAAGQAASGAPKAALKDYAKNADRVKFFATNSEDLTGFVNKARGNIKDGVQETLGNTGKEVFKVIEENELKGKLSDIAPLKKAINDRIAEAALAAEKGRFTPEALKPLNNLKSIKDNYFISSTTGEELPDLVPPSVAFKIKQQLKELSKPGGDPRALSKILDPAAKEAKAFGDEGYAKVTESLNALDERLPLLNKNYASQSDAANNLLKRLTTEDKAESFFANLNAPSKRTAIRQLERMLTPERMKQAQGDLQALQTQSYFGDPSLNSVSGLGSTSTTRTVPLALWGSGIGSYLGYKIGNSPGAALLGGAIGAKAGATLGSPKAVGAGLRTLNNAENYADKIPGKRPALYGAGQSAWEALKEQYTEGK